ncbi:bifunctional diaminohydroxyphosphoribosylaminopyrimidine deaminase/5-amino-6-(5-phosphoribosylamino)uracil reductase RibD [Volucribacter amazonae]|uniref:Riboflavin biosynthesis protein RibD n=1 Tax=Volucribacter amazonae TaxID=256731 RepID=A0A9X4PAW5_9PAST|nr:bifunctional diaminohydroxyphosphoribosylaminopyrimidine deaminase/5-amino-6-(5-phosphoribosylamino)uracil reductase RibD [Volucribacter amazonae]MDG6894294.1 bifunctional diaminohydroxyphosphoribosylaminopyrimidine deaminase/5-amino-6-(5-phosphoribosylamino)uracil reductase [Volucribacter amazonae]
MTFRQQDYQFMQLALDLAKQGEFTTSPNPAVGCVIVNKDEIVGQGFHVKAGEPHAEVMALRMAGHKAKGATAYVTLEPCAHFGRTPPCAMGLIGAGVSRVIAAMQDPNPQVAGKGLAMLEKAGIATQVGLLAESAEWLNRGFLKRMRTGLPYVRLKMAMTIDGRTATATGESKWITGQQARADVQVERAKASAILSTSQTVLMDNAQLNVRWQQLPEGVKQGYPDKTLRQPIRIIMDRHHQLSADLALFQTNSPIYVVSQTEKKSQNLPHFCQAISLPALSGTQQLVYLMEQLGQRQINSVWVEAGATFAGALVEADLVDELIVYIAPKLLGDQARGLCHLPHLTQLAQAPQWRLQEVKQFDQDLKLIYVKDKLC